MLTSSNFLTAKYELDQWFPIFYVLILANVCSKTLGSPKYDLGDLRVKQGTY
jgi:hypothetical protein